ncbi:MAG: hypothetical protein ACYCPW_01920 [Nitrososphaerales archaeon]
MSAKTDLDGYESKSVPGIYVDEVLIALREMGLHARLKIMQHSPRIAVQNLDLIA